MSSKIYDALAAQWAQVLLADNTYASLHYEVPSQTEPGDSEVSGPSYSRAILSWDDSTSPRLLSNVQQLVWQNLDAVTIVGVGVWSQPTSGDLWVFAQLDAPVVVAERGSYSLDVGSLWVSI